MTLDDFNRLNNSPAGSQGDEYYHLRDHHHPSASLKERSLSSTPSETSDWVSPYTLPPLPSFRRDRDHTDTFHSPEYLRQRDGSGAYYAAAWGSPYATPSPRRTPQPVDSASPRLNFRAPYLPNSSRTATFLTPRDQSERRGAHPRHRVHGEVHLPDSQEGEQQPHSEKPNWLSDSEDSGSETSLKEGENTPTRVAYLDSWGVSPSDHVRRSPVKHRSTESLATVTQDTFHVAGNSSIRSGRYRTPLSSLDHITMAEPQAEEQRSASPEKPLPVLPRRSSHVEDNEPERFTTAPRPRIPTMQSFQRPKKKVIWKGKACIIALPLSDRADIGLPPLLRPEEVKERIQAWIESGYSVEGFELIGHDAEGFAASSGQSRTVYPDPGDLQAERKTRQFNVHVPDQAEWEVWVNRLKEEKLRALGVSPSNSEAPPSTRSPFSQSMSRVSSAAYPTLTTSPPVAPSSAASNPLRATSNSFSPSLMSSAGMSSQAGSVTSPQHNRPPKNMHGYKASVAYPAYQGRISPYEPAISQATIGGNGARPHIQPLSSRQNSFSPNQPPQLPDVGEVLSQSMHVRAPSMQSGHDQNRTQPVQNMNQGLPQPPSQHTPSPAHAQRPDSLVHTPRYSESSRTPIEIAHPTPKSHRHNLSMTLQRDIDEAEAALHAKHDSLHADDMGHFDQASRKDLMMDESMNEEPPILRRPDTLTQTDERSEVETNPSIAATPLLMDDKNPFANWQALSDAAKAESKPAVEAASQAPKFNVEAKEFDPRAGFSSSNFSFGGSIGMPFGLPPSKSASERPPAMGKFSTTHLNADAPAFTPSFTSVTSPTEAPFQFSSATFNVAAPEFDPSQSPGTNFKGSEVADSGEEARNTLSSIFGNVVIDPGAKATRRSSKPVPALAPKSKDGQSEEPDSTDEMGRPMPPTERQKRARRQDSDGDRSPVFADSAPFRHRSILSDIIDAVDAKATNTEIAKEQFDGWAYIAEDGTQLTDNRSIDDLDEQEDLELPVGQEDGKGPEGAPTAFTFENDTDAAMFNEARPPLDVVRVVEHGKHAQEGSSSATEEPMESTAKPADTSETSNQQSKPALSALARPFDFNPRVSRGSFDTPRKSQGLEASKYATPSSPTTDLTANLSSPPADLPHFVEEDHESVNDADDTVEVFEEDDELEDKPVEEDIVEVIEEASTDDEVERSRRTSQHHKASDVYLSAKEDDLDMPVSSLRHQEQPVPSFEEIDAVMKHLETHPELGVERLDTPFQSTPLVDMRLGPKLRSDGPSPSPRRVHQDKVAQSDTSYPPSNALGIGVHQLNTGRDDISDWGDALPAPEAAKLQLRSQFFDGHVNELVDGLLENRLGPLERTLQSIQHSLTSLAPQPKPKKERRSLSEGPKESDADDEDDYDALEGLSSYRDRSPMARRGERKHDLMRAAVAEALAAHTPAAPPPPAVDMTEVTAVLQEMRQLAQPTGSQNTQAELKKIMEDVIAHHPRLRGSRVREDHETAEMKFKPQIDGLESMLKISQEHAAEEARLRRKGEEEINELKLRLRIAEEEAAQYRESSEEAQHTLTAFMEEKESFKRVELELEGLTLKNNALENTLEEYRVSSDQWREDIRNERANSKDLKRTMQELHQQLQEQTDLRQNLRAKIERLQSQMTQVVQDIHGEQEDWRNKEHSLHSKIALTQDALEHERRHREKAEMELDTLDKEHKAKLHLETIFEQTRSDLSRLNEEVIALREENRALDTKAFNLDRELSHVKNSKDAELATATAKLHVELESASYQLQNIRTDAEAQIVRLQGRVDHAELDLEEQKAKHDSLMSETVEAHQQALREITEKKETALEDQHQSHEKKLNELREHHTRELHNSFDTRTRLEHQYNERLSLNDDKVKHLESKVADLEDRLAITKSAARAAVEAATAKGVNLHTPASSVVASPPQRVATASMSYARGSEVPDKISPQALRESIMVLQDQLQNREQRIEQLEAEVAAIDKEAPARVKDRDTEISWLRELLNVRNDDLEDITNTLSKSDFDRESVRDAAIRLRANLQMEQQLRERAAAGGLSSSFPSITSLSAYAQSPRALPMAAAAAWGNWRKARDTSLGALSDLATNLGSQTPSKSTIGSPSSFLSGMITPPATSQKTPSSSQTPIPAPPSMRPLAAAAAQSRKSGGLEARPLRAYNSQPRALSARQAEKRPESAQSQYDTSPPSQLKSEPPRTPTQVKINPNLDLTDDVDDDASPLDGKDPNRLDEAVTSPLAE